MLHILSKVQNLTALVRAITGVFATGPLVAFAIVALIIVIEHGAGLLVRLNRHIRALEAAPTVADVIESKVTIWVRECSNDIRIGVSHPSFHFIAPHTQPGCNSPQLFGTRGLLTPTTHAGACD